MTICSESRPCWLIIYIKKKSYGKTAVLVRRVAPQDRHRKVRRRLSCMVHQSSPGTRKTRINLSLTPFLSLSGIMSLAALRIRSGIRWGKKKTATIPRSSHPGRFHSATDPAARSADGTHGSIAPVDHHHNLQATVDAEVAAAPPLARCAERSMRGCTFSYSHSAMQGPGLHCHVSGRISRCV